MYWRRNIITISIAILLKKSRPGKSKINIANAANGNDAREVR